MRILVVEDERKVASFIEEGFKQEGHAVDVVTDGEMAAYQAESYEYDLLVLDLMLPKLSGMEVLKRARQAKKARLPVIILTARGELEDRVRGLDAGADDYLVKPFAFAELSARARALSRQGAQQDTILQIADLELNTATRSVIRSGRKIELKNKEYVLLEFLLRHANRPVTRIMITEHVWDIHFDSVSNVVDVHINSLRNKIDKGFDPPLIHTQRGIGYILTEQP
jgi:DNA-binding response OmpR family regulator